MSIAFRNDKDLHLAFIADRTGLDPEDTDIDIDECSGLTI